MKRDSRLRDLSDDHHQALVLARRATRAAADESAPCTAVWKEVVRRFHSELVQHFAIEEQYLLPALEKSGAADLARRTRDEHHELRRIVCEDPKDIRNNLGKFGALLRQHVRFEERILFEAIQATLGREALDAAAEACRIARSNATQAESKSVQQP